MSGPKCTDPTYVSDAERARRALAEAQGAADSAAERLEAARAAAPPAFRGRPLARPAAGDVEGLLRFVRDADRAIEDLAAKQRLAAAIAELDAADGAVRAPAGRLEDPAATGRAPRADRVAALEEITRELKGDLDAILEIGGKWTRAADPASEKQLRAQLLHAAQRHRRQSAERDRARSDADALLARIAGIAGDEADRLRRRIETAAARGSLPAELERGAAALDSADKDSHVARVVSEVLARAMADTSGFETAFDLPGKPIALEGVSGAFAVFHQEPDGRIHFEPVRSDTCTATDGEIQRAYHSRLMEMRDAAAQRGVDMTAEPLFDREPEVRTVHRRSHRERRIESEAPAAKTMGPR